VEQGIHSLDNGYALFDPLYGGGEPIQIPLSQQIRVGSIFISVNNWLQIVEGAGNLALLTIDWGKKDIEQFRNSGGGHVVSPYFSLISWQHAPVNWNLYGADDPSLSVDEVWDNFADAMNQRMQEAGP
jgi:hypothetical protein